MYRVVANISGRIARIIPAANARNISERDFGELSLEDALANKDGLEDAVRELLLSKGVTHAETFTVSLPDVLRSDLPSAPAERKIAERGDFGPVTRPDNPKEGEQNSETNRPETKDVTKKPNGAKPEEVMPTDKDNTQN